jgi:hypothetical protein
MRADKIAIRCKIKRNQKWNIEQWKSY